MEDLVRFLFEKTGHQVGANSLVAEQAEDGAGRIILSLGESDVSRLAGAEARLLRALRLVLSAAAAAKNTRVSLEINEV